MDHPYKLKAHEHGFQLVRFLWPASYNYLNSYVVRIVQRSKVMKDVGLKISPSQAWREGGRGSSHQTFPNILFSCVNSIWHGSWKHTHTHKHIQTHTYTCTHTHTHSLTHSLTHTRGGSPQVGSTQGWRPRLGKDHFFKKSTGLNLSLNHQPPKSV